MQALLSDEVVTYEREIGGLKKFLKAFPEYQGYVITHDEENEVMTGDKTIPVITVWKCLLLLTNTSKHSLFNPIKIK